MKKFKLQHFLLLAPDGDIDIILKTNVGVQVVVAHKTFDPGDDLAENLNFMYQLWELFEEGKDFDEATALLRKERQA